MSWSAGDPVYGMTTGVRDAQEDQDRGGRARGFNRAMIRNHRTGQGPPFADDVVRAAMLRLANSFASGLPGARPSSGTGIVGALNEHRVPARALARLGRPGRSGADGRPGVRVVRRRCASRPRRASRCSNSGAFSTSLAALALADTTRLADALDVAGGLDLEAFAANLTILHPRVAETRPYPGLTSTVERLRERARRQLSLGRGCGPQPAGSRHVPLHPADARRAARCARLRTAGGLRSS